LKGIWPDAAEVQTTIDSSISTEMFTKEYGAVFDETRALDETATIERRQELAQAPAL